MPNSILHKRSSTAGVVPHAALLANGEIALNTADGTWFIKKTDGTVLDLRQPLITDGGAQPLAGVNADAQDWQTRVIAAGGTVSATTFTAVNNFCNSIDAAGIRDRFYRLNLFCGSDLAACLVPLYRGPSLAGTQYGTATDTNSNFVAGDYAETGTTGGLNNSSNKSLNTGLSPDVMVSAASGHLAYYGSQWTPTTTLNPGSIVIGAMSADAAIRVYILGRGNAGTCGGAAAQHASQLGSVSAGSQCSSDNNIVSGFYVSSRTSTTRSDFYRDAVGVGFWTGTNSYSNFADTLRVFNAGYNGSASLGPAVIRLTAYSAGVGMSGVQVAAYTAAMRAFQRELQRIPPVVSNADAQDWLNRVYAAGGTVSQSTADAVNTFCNTIDAAGLRDKFYRLNLFCGNNLTACLVPLYRGPELGNGQNLLRSSQEFNLPVWQKEGSVVLSDVGVAPNATVTADLLREDATNNSHRVFQSVTAAANATVTTSIYVKQAGGTRNINLRLQAGADNINATFNLTTGQVTPASGGTGSVTNTAMTLVSGWWRLVLTGIPSSTAANPSLSIYLHNGSTTFYTGDGVSGVHIWGAQTELSSVATAYSGAIYGSTTDTNINFLAADYVETGVNGGLLGNGSSKYLQTGLTTAALPTLATGHLAAYTINATGQLIASFNSGFDGFNFYGLGSSSVFTSRFSWGSIVSLAPTVAADLRRGFISMTRTDSTTSKAYKNGLQIGETFSTSSITLPNSGGGFSVFAAMAETGSVLSHLSGRLGAYSIGSGMTDAQMVTYNNAMQAFQTALNRPLAVSNVDAQDWVARVYEAGGTVSQSTADAVNTFCNSINSTGLRDRFYRLNLFCGNDLTACRVPLYRGQSLSGTQFGNTTDTNFNFVASDYVERGTTGGLTGNGNLGVLAGTATKHLRTGLQQASIGTSLMHLSVFVFGLNTTATQQQSFVGIRDNFIPVNRWWVEYRGVVNTELGGPGSGSGFGMNAAATGNFLIMASRESNTLLRSYFNGLRYGTDATADVSATLKTSTRDFFVSAANIDGEAVEFCHFRLGMYSVGLTMTETQAGVFNSAVAAFNTALNRS